MPSPPTTPGLSTPPASRLGTWWQQLGFGTERHSRRVLVLAAFGLLIGFAEAAVVVLAVAIVSEGGGDRVPLLGDSPPSTGVLTAIALGALLVLAVSHLASAAATARFGAEAERTVQQLLVSAYLRAPWAAQSAAPAGDLQNLVLHNASLVAQGTQQAATALATLLNLVVVAVVALLVSPWATLLLGAATAVVVAAALPFRARTRRSIDRTVASAAEVAAGVSEKAALARDLRVFGVTDRAVDEMGEGLRGLSRSNEAVRRLALATPRLTRDAAVAVLVGGIAVVVSTSEVAMATVAIVVVLVFRALGHAQSLAGVAQALVQRRGNLRLIQERLHAWRPRAPRGTRPCGQIRRLRLAGVGHAYAPDAPPALDAVDLTLERGEMLGLVGPSGAGKSTLAAILLGLLVPARGAVEVDGVPLEELDPAAWHARTALVAQEPVLLRGTVAENVRFLRPAIGDDRVATALRAAGLGPAVAAWEDGAGHHAGPGGSRLSGGERQRVALARAIAGDPDLIVLDEPTSALDAQTEAAVREALDALRGGAAILVIAHRLSTIRSCDRVAVLERGRITAMGPPHELEAASPWFRRAVELSGVSGPLR